MSIGYLDLSRTMLLERKFSSNIFKALPPEQGDFRPQEGMRTVTEQLSHIGAFDDWLFQGLKHGNWAVDIFIDRPESSVEEALAYMDYNRKLLMGLIDELKDEGLLKAIGPNPAYTPQMAVGNLILTSVTHECHHRGQLVAYIRTMGLEPPYLYGMDGSGQ